MNSQAAFDFMRPAFAVNEPTKFRIDLTDKLYGPYCEICVMQNDDRTWAKKIGYQISYMGMGGPFYGAYITAEAALESAVEYFRQSFQRTLDNPCSVQSDKDRVHLRRFLAWLDEVSE
ncbi:hypothetical protein CU102_12390 [Phyllobacterium brassicacearum]|uniref:Uncharacterized protein n=1 Tax=Phyllobacterium brassicacearum TaxID=314235 RepID=A0A2P7BQ34_9HYPH|nr:hypothetical protein [Phyllobacterium brassicacearum]PSH68556.1 hypothetical protein CU102_12390 [Phyllobacterium brassicacearum]TDQ19905.1 hypothetical protein DEV91_124100 [Phyllobacterium brassicacearum]